MSTPHETLVRLLLPEGLLEYFDLTNVAQAPASLNIYLEEKNLPPLGYEKSKLESKGFLPETAIQDFPIRGHKVALCIKRRRSLTKHAMIWKSVKLRAVLFWCQQLEKTFKNIICHIGLKSILQ